MSDQLNIIIAGASGLIGSKLLEKLLANSNLAHVVSLGRRKLEFEHERLHQELVDFEQLDQTYDADIAFCCLGTTIKKAGSQEAFQKVDHHFVVNFAKSLGSKTTLVVISAKSADAMSSIFYNKVKGEMESELKSLGLGKLIIVRPSLLIGERSESRPAEAIGIKLLSPIKGLLKGLTKTYTPIEDNELAQAMIELAFNGDTDCSILEYEIVEN